MKDINNNTAKHNIFEDMPFTFFSNVMYMQCVIITPVVKLLDGGYISIFYYIKFEDEYHKISTEFARIINDDENDILKDLNLQIREELKIPILD